VQSWSQPLDCHQNFYYYLEDDLLLEYGCYSLRSNSFKPSQAFGKYLKPALLKYDMER